MFHLAGKYFGCLQRNTHGFLDDAFCATLSSVLVDNSVAVSLVEPAASQFPGSLNIKLKRSLRKDF